MTRTLIAIISLLYFTSCGNHHVLKEVIKLEHYPSASAIEFFDGKFYVIGDDANQLIILDSNLAIIDSVPLFSYSEKRIPKSLKPDLEGITILRQQGGPQLLLTGSGSLSPYRNAAYLFNPLTRKLDSTRLDSFYSSLKGNGIFELNIEGVCAIPGSLIFSNRGHKNYRRNHLVIGSVKSIFQNPQAPYKIIRIGNNADSSIFNGISGLGYAPKSDRLIITVSTEDTRSVLDDGAIGKSYLWIVKNISSKRNWMAINPNQVIDLGSIDSRFDGQKIESVCVTAETNNFLHLVLAADNDDGSSTLFRLVIEKN